MQRLLLLACLFFTAPSANEASDTVGKGSVGLDDVTFEKIIGKFDAALVKFDVAFPYGDKHDAYMALAREAVDIDELLVAEVGVKDYADKDNEALANKHGAFKEDFPVVKLFLKDQKNPITFDSSMEFTTNELRKFVREKTGMYLSLPGCLKELDHFAIHFMDSSKSQRLELLEEVQTLLKSLPKENVATGKVYRTIMDKVMEKGNDFVKTEHERVKKLLTTKISNDKKKQMSHRLNILQTFLLHKNKKEEL